MVDLVSLTEPLTHCPGCGGPLLEQDRSRPERRRVQDRGLPTWKTIQVPVPAIRCDAEEPCGWLIQGSGSPIGNRLSSPDVCSQGHRWSWGNPRTRFGRVEFVCLGFLPGLLPCPERATVGGQHQGFLRDDYQPPSLPFRAKLPVLLALARAGESGMAIGELAAGLPGLSRGQLAGELRRGVEYHFLIRSAEQVVLVPRGKGYVYALGERGRAWLDWAAGQWWYLLMTGEEYEA